MKDAAIFLAELGIARAAAAFEDYATGAKAELDRAGVSHAGVKANGTSALHGFDAVVGLDTKGMTDLLRLASFSILLGIASFISLTGLTPNSHGCALTPPWRKCSVAGRSGSANGPYRCRPSSKATSSSGGRVTLS